MQGLGGDDSALGSSELTEKLLQQEPLVFAGDQHVSTGISQAQFGQEQILFVDEERPGSVKNDDYAATSNRQLSTVPRGEKQSSNQYRDIGALFLFTVHLLAIVIMALRAIPMVTNYALPSSDSSSSSSSSTTLHLSGIFLIYLLASVTALGIMGLWVTVMTRFLEYLIQMALLTSVASNIMVIILLLSSGAWSPVGLSIAIGLLLWTLCFVRSIWRRLPFCAANLQTAVAALFQTGTSSGGTSGSSITGIALVAYGLVLLLLIYTILWILAWIGTFVTTADCDLAKATDDIVASNCSYQINTLSVLLFCLSYFWTFQVLSGILHVTVAGVVGTWWFAPEETAGVWSVTIQDAFARATTSSLGSVCLGALLTSVIQVLYQLCRTTSRRLRYSFLLCVLECILGFLDRIVCYFTQYATVYVGLYGYDFLTAGQKTATLFAARGWTTIINDDLVARVLWLSSWVVGAMTGTIGLILSHLHPVWTEDLGSAQVAVVFLICFLIGTGTANIVTSIVASAVNTIVVAFCEAPLDFERNHPVLYRQMHAAWLQVYPDDYRS